MWQEKQRLRKAALKTRDGIDPPLRAEKSARICEQLEVLLAEDLRLSELSELSKASKSSELSNLSKSSVSSDSPLTIAVYQAVRSEVDLSLFVERAYEWGVCVCFPCMMEGGYDLDSDPDSSSDFAPDSNSGTSHMVMRKVGRGQFLEALTAGGEGGVGSSAVGFVDKPLKIYAPDDPGLIDFPEVEPLQLDWVIVPLVAFDSGNRRLGYGGGNYDRLLAALSPGARIVGVAFCEQEIPLVPTEVHDLPLSRILRA